MRQNYYRTGILMAPPTMLRMAWEAELRYFHIDVAHKSDSGEAVLRLVQPRDMDYSESWRRAYPFDGPAAGLSDTRDAQRMIDEATALMYQAVEAGVVLNIVGNNRAWGNTPDLGRTLAHRFLDFAERKGA